MKFKIGDRIKFKQFEDLNVENEYVGIEKERYKKEMEGRRDKIIGISKYGVVTFEKCMFEVYFNSLIKLNKTINIPDKMFKL